LNVIREGLKDKGMVFNRLVSYGEETSYGVAPSDVARWVGGDVQGRLRPKGCSNAHNSG